MPADIKFGVALIQMLVTPDREVNVQNAVIKIREAVTTYRPRLVCLPECFNSPYGVQHFDTFAEYVPSGHTSQILSALAKELKVYILGGTIPERDQEDKKKLYNTAAVYGPDGEIIAKHRKVHLFDVNFKDYTFNESHSLTRGNKATTFSIDGIKFGLGICFDIYFDEYARCLRNMGCDILLFPNAFNTGPIGPLHWDLLNRARATDNQVYLASISPARDENGEYVAWGHTMISDPWGRVLVQAGTQEEIVYYEIDFSGLPSLRKQIPLFGKRVPAVYNNKG